MACDNSRGIALLSTGGKVLSQVMLVLVLEHVTDKFLPETQSGCSRGRGTIDMLFVTR